MLPESPFPAGLALALVSLLLVPTAAGAATVDKTDSCDVEYGLCGSDISYAGAPGEANDVTIASDSSGAVLITDAGAPLTTVGNCTRVDEHRARCVPAQGPRGGNLSSTFADGGDGDDRIVLETLGLVDGGSGSDFIDAASVTYGGVGTPLTIDLAAGTATTAGSTDTLSPRVARVFSGKGDDVLRGSDRDEDLDGGDGNDSVSGGGGDDEVIGGAGRDSLDGGAGDDHVAAQEPGKALGERVVCGEGDDVAGGLGAVPPYLDPVDIVAADCESVWFAEIGNVRPQVRVKGGRVNVAVPGDPCDCTGKLAVRSSSGRLLASGRTTGARHRLSVPLTAAGRRYLRRGARRTVVLTWTANRERSGFTTRVQPAS